MADSIGACVDSDAAEPDPQIPPVAENEPFLAGERIAFTGTLASMTHHQAAELAERHAAETTHHVSHQTTILVVGEEGWPLEEDGKPAQKFQLVQEWNAQGASIRVMRESDWLAMFGLAERSQDVHHHYTPAMLGQMLNVPVAVIRRWERIGLIHAVRKVHRLPYFDFREATRIRRLNELLSSGVDRESLEESLRSFAELFPDADVALDAFDLLVIDSRLCYRDERGLVESLSNQRVFDFDPPEETPEIEETSEQVVNGADEPPQLLPFVSNRQPESQRSAEEWHQEGCQRMEENDPVSAIEAFRLSLMEDSSQAETHFHLADALYLSGQLTASLERYYATVEIDPEYLEAWTQIGCLHAEMEQLSSAVAALRIALAIHPDYPDAQLHLAEALYQLGETATARTHWEAYLQYDTRGPWADLARQRLAETDQFQPEDDELFLEDLSPDFDEDQFDTPPEVPR
ncbi:tetratricopeptide repeat protein [Calycomorphotria hydatis]|nr:tetratricopeptide repeat protein [Calycomorphotria hydatis]